MELERLTKGTMNQKQTGDGQPVKRVIEVTLKTASSRYVDGEYAGTNWVFNVVENGKWYTGKTVLRIPMASEDLAAKDIEHNYRDGLFHKFGEFKKIA